MGINNHFLKVFKACSLRLIPYMDTVNEAKNLLDRSWAPGENPFIIIALNKQRSYIAQPSSDKLLFVADSN